MASSDLGGDKLSTAQGTHRIAAASDFRLHTDLVDGCSVLAVLILQAIHVALQLDDASLNLFLIFSIPSLTVSTSPSIRFRPLLDSPVDHGGDRSYGVRDDELAMQAEVDRCPLAIGSRVTLYAVLDHWRSRVHALGCPSLCIPTSLAATRRCGRKPLGCETEEKKRQWGSRGAECI